VASSGLVRAAEGATVATSRPFADDSRAPGSRPMTAADIANLKRAFVDGREYFILRSGSIQLIAQAARRSALTCAFERADSCWKFRERVRFGLPW
jgi:hypothetical protein